MPYITMSIIMQLLVVIIPQLKKISEEEGGRKKVQRWTRYATVVVSIIQGFVITQYSNSIPDAVKLPQLQFAILAIFTLTVGTLFLMWLGEQISQRGIGNGVSLIIFVGIVSRMPAAIISLIQSIQRGDLNPVFALIVGVLFIIVVSLVVLEQQGQRKIPVNYAKRVVGRKVYGGQNTYIPFKINPSGVIPVIFASSLLAFPVQFLYGMASQWTWLVPVLPWLAWNHPFHLTVQTLLIIFFSYFYTQVSLNPEMIAKQIRENGGSVPGIRSEKIEEYLTRILNRIILPGSLFLAFIALTPSLVQIFFRFPSEVAQLLGGTSLLILVGVDLDTMSQIEGHLRTHGHEGIGKYGKIRSRNL
jgi:preprotein translocase subunit SecY